MLRVATEFRQRFRPRQKVPASGAMPLPPEPLRYRVHGASPGDGGESFLRVGQQCAQDVVTAVAGTGQQLSDFKSILDFGVGCGRTLRWLAPLAPAAQFYGTDIDREAIAWCRAHLGFANFAANDPLPPLPFANGLFDFIYAVSVFTHLDESYQFHWLAELRRIARPGAIVVLTLHGDFLFHLIPPELRWQAETNGYVFVESNVWKGIFPDWYQNTFHSRQYIYKWYPGFFRVLQHVPQGLAGHQDIVVLQRE